MQQVLLLLGQKGIILLIGTIAFLLCYKYSVNLFQWIEDQTYGTRDYVMQKLELLQKDISEKHITIALLVASFGSGLFILSLFFLMGNGLLGVILGTFATIVGWKLPRPFMEFLIERRMKQFQAQMVDGLGLLANGLRAGLSIPQAIGMIVDELPPPISEEFNLILQQNKIGSPLEECFEELAKRIPLQDNEMFVTSVNILRETGGNLAEVFDTIIDVIRERVRLQQKIETYVQQVKMQGLTIGFMPTALFMINYISDPASGKLMVSTPLGIIALVIAASLNIGGGYVMYRIMQIKV